MHEASFAQQLTLLRKQSGMTQEELAQRLHVSPQAVSKWENQHSLPETALLPALARALDTSIDALFSDGGLTVLEALFGDGMESTPATKRLNRMIEDNRLCFTVSAVYLGIPASQERVACLTVKYRSRLGICLATAFEGETLCIHSEDAPREPSPDGLSIVAGRYGTRLHNSDVMQKIAHYQPFGWDAYRANHEVFPSDPANDHTEYLTLVYLNSEGVHMATCAEGESLAYSADRTQLVRRCESGSCSLPHVPPLPPFGEGMECSWAAALTAALQAMRVQTTYDEVMGVSGACYRLAFCSPGWDYSAVDALVAYDYATPGYAAYGYAPEMYGHIDKADRAEHRQRIAREIRSHMPVLGINLRVAPEWGVICGYAKEGAELFCRTKYDRRTLDNDPAFSQNAPPFDPASIEKPPQYLLVDNWPFLLCYFSQKRKPPTPQENLQASLKVFVDCAEKAERDGYHMGFRAYETWADGLRDEAFYATCDDGQIARRFSVHQFCALALHDARRAAASYLRGAAARWPSASLEATAACFVQITAIAERMQRALDSGEALDGAQSRAFWTRDKRHAQADMLDEMARLERGAHAHARAFLAQGEA